jgi:hypothetical protein
MKPDAAEDLRAAFSARPVRQEVNEATLSMVWKAVSGSTSPADLASVLEQVRREPAVAEAWRVARSVRAELDDEEPARVERQGKVVLGPAHWWRGAAGMGIGTVMAMAAVVVMYVVPMSENRGPVAMRADVLGIENTLVYAGSVDRDHAVLRWTALPEGTVYTVTVTTDLLARVARGGALDKPEWVIPGPQLSALPDGTVLLWRVEATLPDGSKHRSATFDVVLR